MYCTYNYVLQECAVHRQSVLFVFVVLNHRSVEKTLNFVTAQTQTQNQVRSDNIMGR